jgi:hypothetical protein
VSLLRARPVPPGRKTRILHKNREESGARQSTRSGAFPNLFQFFNPNRPIREDGSNVEFASHRSDHIAKRAEIHVRAVLQFGDGRLPYFQLRGKLLLCELTRFPEFVERQFTDHSFRFGLGTPAGLGRHIPLQLLEILCHWSTLPFQRGEMLVVQRIGDGNEYLVPAILARLVGADRRHRARDTAGLGAE